MERVRWCSKPSARLSTPAAAEPGLGAERRRSDRTGRGARSLAEHAERAQGSVAKRSGTAQRERRDLMAKDEKAGRRSQEWFAGGTFGFAHRSWVRSESVPTDHFDGRPVIGICNTWSELTPCNSHFRIIAQHVREGILEAGGVPMEFPVISTGEMLTRPTAMLLRNLASMDVEESIRANPLDGVVLLMGCDKTSPALLMGAASVNLPTIGVSGGSMLNGSFRGRDVGVADAWKITDQYRAGEVTDAEMLDLELGLSRSHGTCNVMGTASTMASMVEVLGLGLPNNAAIPAVDARRNVLARMAGRRIVDLVREGVVISQILTREAFENAIRVNVAIGGSTNAVIHLTALARRVGVELSIDELGLSRPIRASAREADDGGKNGDGTICTIIELLGFFGNDEGMAIALRKLLDGGEATFRLEPGSATLISVTLA